MRNTRPLVEPESLGEDWAPYPKPGETIVGQGRSSIYRLDKKGEIRSALLRRPGCQRGLRMVYVPSVREYVERVAAMQKAELDRVAGGITSTSSSTSSTAIA